ncbi:MAG: hypothetical protein ABL962_20065 [Fimbriimonadaceae bacterium]
MKCPSIVAILIVIFSQSLEAQEAAVAVERLRTSYTAAVKRATDPLKETYRKELNKLLDQYTKSGKLDDALTVRNELASLSGAQQEGFTTDSPDKKRKLTQRQFEKQLLESKWLIGQKLESADAPIPPTNTYTFNDNGTFHRGDGEIHGWRFNSDGELLLFTEAGADWGVTVTQNPDGTLSSVQTGKKWPQDRFTRIEKAPK